MKNNILEDDYELDKDEITAPDLEIPGLDKTGFFISGKYTC